MQLVKQQYSVRTPDLWPTVILISAAAAGYVTFAQVESVVRPVVTLWFLLLCPGMAFVQLLRLGDRVAELSLALALSLALNMLLAGAMLYSGMWSPQASLLIIICVTTIGVVIRIAVGFFRHVDAQLRLNRSSVQLLSMVVVVIFGVSLALALFFLIKPVVPSEHPLAQPAFPAAPTAQSADGGTLGGLPVLPGLPAPVTQISRAALDGTIIFLLIALLVQKEVVRSLTQGRASKWMRSLDMAIAPLLLIFLYLVVVRLLELMRVL
jgi:hypothetical protein